MDAITELSQQAKYLRQLDLFNPLKMNESVLMVGAGGIGGPTALQLAKLGLDDITVIDPDRVEDHNQPNQIYGPLNIGEPKVEALWDIVSHLTGASITTGSDKITEDGPAIDRSIVISGVDSMASRKIIWAKVKYNPSTNLFIDGRIGGEVLSVYTVNPLNVEDVERYESTLFDDSQAAPLPCTARAVIDVGFIIGGLITRAVRRYLVDKHKDFEIILDVRNMVLLKR